MGLIQRLARGRPVTVDDSIAQNLTAALNARKGYAEAAEVFGMADFEDPIATKKLVAELGREMVRCVKAHEPRAAKPEVSFLGRESSLFAVFRLRCEIDERPAAFRIRMQTILRYVTVDPIPAGLPDEGAAR